MSTATAVSGSDSAAVGYVAFLESLAGYLQSQRKGDDCCALIVVHMCNLNRINTSAGYRTGYRIRCAFARELTKMLRDGDWMMPLTEERLGVVLHRVKNTGHMMLAANRIAQIASEISRAGSVNTTLEVRVGAALFPEHGHTAEKLLRNSELAVESAALQRTANAVYKPEVSRRLTGNWGLEADLGAAVENSEFALVYQPKIDAGSLRPCGAEALLRWHHPRLGVISPDRFIQLAEATGRIDALTDFALRGAARDSASWPKSGADLTVAINLSPAVIEQGDVVASFQHAAAIWGIDMEKLTAEVTENGIISTDGRALRVLHDLRNAGVRVSIDDFGTGNSSLAYFKDIPADELKIDKSFVFAMLNNERSNRLVKTIIDLAHGFDLQVVAEGVENAQCAERLRQLGCDVLQGYYFSKPLPQNEFIRYLLEESAQAED